MKKITFVRANWRAIQVSVTPYHGKSTSSGIDPVKSHSFAGHSLVLSVSVFFFTAAYMAKYIIWQYIIYDMVIPFKALFIICPHATLEVLEDEASVVLSS